MVVEKQRVLEGETFERLFEWLDPDRDRAGEKYEEVRARLIQIFEARGCPVAEELADATLDRVATKVEDIAGTYVGKPELYFYGVAQNIYREYLRKKPIHLPPNDPPRAEEFEHQYQCLDNCLQRLTPKSRKMILQYYQAESHKQVEFRKNLARRIGIGTNALRIRVHRIREHLAVCLTDCLKDNRKE
jgi:DNA-directed RNA polymerase specialized sigma24 family protein